MKNITKIFVAALSVVFCVSVGRLIIDNKNHLHNYPRFDE